MRSESETQLTLAKQVKSARVTIRQTQGIYRASCLLALAIALLLQVLRAVLRGIVGAPKPQKPESGLRRSLFVRYVA